uniref:Uncharacterized protein n=1 Tax=Apteryx owenii TaxID=8824 RepID=A0A8B9QC11_APTOW
MEGLWGFGSTTVQTQLWISKLAYQVEVLANATRDSLSLINTQMQATTKMALQNRMAMDLMLLHQNGLCGYLNLLSTDCCVYIPNVTQDLNTQLETMWKGEKWYNFKDFHLCFQIIIKMRCTRLFSFVFFSSALP